MLPPGFTGVSSHPDRMLPLCWQVTYNAAAVLLLILSSRVGKDGSIFEGVQYNIYMNTDLRCRLNEQAVFVEFTNVTYLKQFHDMHLSLNHSQAQTSNQETQI